MDDFERKVKDFPTKPEGTRATDWLAPDTPQHAFALQYIKDRISYSQDEMSKFYPRWRANELRVQAYIHLQDFEKQLKDAAERGAPSGPVSLVVPYSWATMNTIVTYLMHMFGGRKPIFQVGALQGQHVKASQKMELLLQMNADRERFLRALHVFLNDAELYNVAVLRTMWKVERRERTITVPPSPEMVALGAQLGTSVNGTKQSEEYVVFEGSTIANIDPYMFFPDPRVPMYEVNEKGEWVCWRSFQGEHVLRKAAATGQVRWIEKVGTTVAGDMRVNSEGSARSARSFGTAHPGENDRYNGRSQVSPNKQIDQGTFIIIPKQLGLSDSDRPETWLFTIGNQRQIIQAERVKMNHGKHPVVVAEPNNTGYAFGGLSNVDMMAPMQDLMSWLINSHMHNIRASLNNQFVVDPNKIDMRDLENPEPGKLIRLKNTPFGGMDPRQAIMQLPVTDVTRSHLSDFQLMSRMAADLTGASDNIRGLQDSGGRKTATEVRTTSDAGSSRLAARGRVISAQAITDLANQMSSNYQQYLSEEMEFMALGETPTAESVRITPDNIQGDFNFPVHDGTLPIDKVGILDIWVQIFQAVQGDQELRQRYSLPGIFDFMAQLGGAQNLESFKAQAQGPQALPPTQMLPAPDGTVADQAQAGNIISLQDALGAMGG